MSSEHATPSGFFVLRTPLLPFDEFIRWGDGLEAHRVSRQSPDAGHAAWNRDVALLRARLRAVINRSEVRQALFLASQSLEASLERWMDDPDTKKGVRTERSLVRYFARMSGRPTPFGLLAGCSIGTVSTEGGDGDTTRLRLASRARYQSKSRFDYSYLTALAASLERLPTIATQLRYRPAASLHRQGDIWHYIEPTIARDGVSYKVVRVENDPVLETVIDRASASATRQQLIDTVLSMRDDRAIGAADAAAYVDELIEAKMLVSMLSPYVTGTSAFDDLVEQLSPSSAAVSLAQARDALDALDQAGLGARRRDYEAIAATLQPLPTTPDLATLFHVDLLKPCEAAILGRSVVDELMRAVAFFASVDATARRESDQLRRFREAFTERYGIAWVPLLAALDPESGIGFGSDESTTPSEQQDASARAALSEFHNVLLRKVVDCASVGAHEMVLHPSDFTPSAAPRRLPDAFSVLGSIAVPSADAVHAGNYRVLLRAATGPSGATLIGRFCHASPELTRLVREHLRDEEMANGDPDVVYAEIVHLPERRAGNIVARPVLRGYEIECFGRSGAPAERQLPLSDLLITVHGKRILLYSQRLGKRVAPRLTTAHAFHRASNQAAYRLLGQLQYRSGANLPVFDWGPLGTLPFLPRVRIGRVVFAEARWQISADESRAIIRHTRQDRFFAVQEWRQQRRFTRWLLFSDGNSTLPVDLDNPLSVDAFVHVLKRTPETTVLEMYPHPDELCVTGPEGRFQHEFVIPFVVHRPTSESGTAQQADQRFAIEHQLVGRPLVRTFAPGSEWLYVRLYGGHATLEHILVTKLKPLIEAALAEGLISSWFFVRYSHPRPHIRLRFRGDRRALASELLLRLHSAIEALLGGGNVWQMEVGTYDRELERYGGVEGIEHAENAFCADSEAVLGVLSVLSNDISAAHRLRMAIVGVDRFLSDFGFGISQRQNLVRRTRVMIREELGVDARAERRLDEKFRQERALLETVLGTREAVGELADTLRAVQAVFDDRSRRMSTIVAALQALDRESRLSRDVEDIASSYVHMHVNRLMRSEPHSHELVIHDFLVRHYDAELNRVRQVMSRHPQEKGLRT